MDKVNLFNILTVGMPESILTVIFAILVCNGKSVLKENRIIEILKIILSSVLMILFATFIRTKLTSITFITISNMLFYYLIFSIIWKCNIRQSILIGSLSMFMIVFSEIVTVMPTTMYIVERFTNYSFLDTKILWSIPTRIIQIISIIILFKFNISFKNNILLIKRWSDLEKSRKTTITLLSFLIMLAVIFNVNYSEIFVKMKINNIDISLFYVSMIVIVIETVIFLCTILFLLNRTTNYENFKEILYRKPDEIFEIILSLSDENQLDQYRQLILKKEGGVINEED